MVFCTDQFTRFCCWKLPFLRTFAIQQPPGWQGDSLSCLSYYYQTRLDRIQPLVVWISILLMYGAPFICFWMSLSIQWDDRSPLARCARIPSEETLEQKRFERHRIVPASCRPGAFSFDFYFGMTGWGFNLGSMEKRTTWQ